MNLPYNNTEILYAFFLVKPYLIKSPENRSVDLGSGVDLACVVGGDPPPTTRWTAPTGLLNYRGSLLKIKQVTEVDYFCIQEG